MAYEFGREWPSYVPRGEVTWLLGRIHVCASDAEVRQELESRRPKQATDEQFETIVAYALARNYILDKSNGASNTRIERRTLSVHGVRHA